MNRKFRLIKTSDFERVRQQGASYAHPLIVLVAHPNDLGYLRVGVTASKAIGNAVRRNRAKRLLREAIRNYLAREANWDILLIAKKSLPEASLETIKEALSELMRKARILD